MSALRFTRNLLAATVLILFGSVVTLAVLEACPFCTAVGLTFTDQMKSKDVVVAAKLVEPAPRIKEGDEELPRAKFEITKVFRGKKIVRPGMKFQAILVGRYSVGEEFFVMGVNPPDINWTTPMKASERLLEYLGRLDTLPERGADRLAFFQDYFEDEESVLAFDAYDEFAKAPYEDMIALKDRMDRERLISLINNDDTSPNRRRLYFTMLGVCGQPEDVKMLEKLILSGSRKQMRGLEALIACYLSLKGEDGVDLVQKQFLENDECEFTETMLALQAVRFHASEGNVIPKKRLVEAVRTVLDRKEVRDMVIADLARWEDWSVMEKLVKIFRESKDDDSWVRIPIISYLFECPLPEAKGYIEELSKIDPDAVSRAKYLSGDFEFDDEEDEDDAEPQPDGADADETGTSATTDVSSNFVDPGSQYISAPMAPDQPRSSSEKTIHRVRKVDLGTDPVASSPTTDVAERENGVAANQSADAVVANSSNSTVPVVVASPASPPPVPEPPVAQARVTWHVVFIPALVSVVLFVLLWSVMSGRFERLIF